LKREERGSEALGFTDSPHGVRAANFLKDWLVRIQPFHFDNALTQQASQNSPLAPKPVAGSEAELLPALLLVPKIGGRVAGRFKQKVFAGLSTFLETARRIGKRE